MKQSVGPYSILGLVGRAGAGKDTCADVLVAHATFARLAFADPLRIEIARSFRIDSRMLTTRHTKERAHPALAICRSDDSRFIGQMAALGKDVNRARSPREILTWWGTEYRRQLHGENYWTLKAHDAIEDLHRQGYRRIVLTDTRFLNEAKFIQSVGGSLWRINRREVDRQRALHRSEIEQSEIPCDIELSNDGSIEQFGVTVVEAYVGSLGCAVHDPAVTVDLT